MIVERHFYYVSFHLGPGITSAFCMVGNLTPSHQTSSIRLSEGNFCPNKHTLPPNEEMITNDSLFLVSFLNQWVKSRCPSAYNLCKYIIVHNIRTQSHISCFKYIRPRISGIFYNKVFVLCSQKNPTKQTNKKRRFSPSLTIHHSHHPQYNISVALIAIFDLVPALVMASNIEVQPANFRST